MKIESAIRELTNGRAAGESGMLPEMVKASGRPLKICTCELAAVCVERGMCSLPQSVWRGECVACRSLCGEENVCQGIGFTAILCQYQRSVTSDFVIIGEVRRYQM